MLRYILIVSASGTTLFSKFFTPTNIKADLLGALVAGMIQFSVKKTGMSISYVELTELGVAICQNHAAISIVAVDNSDGEIFAKLIANETLRLFITRFSQQLEQRSLSISIYGRFSSDIAEAVRNCVRPVLNDLATHRRVVLAVLTSSQGNNVLHATQDVDKISVLAHHSRLLDIASEVLSGNEKIDHHSGLTLKNLKTTLILYRIERCSLAVVVKNKAYVGEEDYRQHLEECVTLVRKILSLASNLAGAA